MPVKPSSRAKKRPGAQRRSPGRAADHAERAEGVDLVVGIGASAGGIEALTAFFSHLPPAPALAFVVMLHQAKGRASSVPEILARHTGLQVKAVTRRAVIRPGHVYVATPGRYLEVRGESLVPVDSSDEEHLTRPVDRLFEGLAEQFQGRAVGVVLSGTGSDGTRGLHALHVRLGLTVVQSEESARFDGMPHSAIAGDQPDFVLPVEKIGAEIVAYASHARQEGQTGPNADVAQRDIIDLLHARLGHDFSGYKGSTVRRRLERRMKLLHLPGLTRYRRYLERNPTELRRLFDELLIGVTNFFRDRDAFRSLERALPALLAGREEGQSIRVWVPGCSTGEEAYSIAMVLKETIEAAGRGHTLQVFATDLDANAIETARAGLYHPAAAVDIGPRRTAKFFTREREFLRVRKELRECLVFAVQNLAEDPPLTRIDLLSCRNLLIYFESRLQKRILPIFHHALRPDGLLFLGSSESLGAHGHLFDVVDKKHKLFRRREVAFGTYVADLPGGLGTDFAALEGAPPYRTGRRAELVTAQLAEKALIREVLPPCVIFRERGEIVHIHGRTGQFLEPAPGPQTSINLFGMAREGLQLELSAATRQAVREEGEVLRRGVRLQSNGSPMLVDLRLRRLTEPEQMRGLLVVSFERLRPADDTPGEDQAVLPVELSRMLELERELLYTKESLRSTIDELEAANQELTSTNEELQSTNEELQSTNEELETSKEELQSLNEELQTVNTELQGKVEELSHANDDMTNLLNATDVATLFLDNDLNIKRHTAQAKRIIRLIPTDVGRPLGDLVSKLEYDGLADDAREVLHTLQVKETEVRSTGGSWYLMRIMPYRTTDGVVDGLVITFVDISRIKELQRSEGRMIRALQNSPVRVFGHDREHRFAWVCSSAFGFTQMDLLGKSDMEVLGHEAQPFTQLKQRAMESGMPTRGRVTASVHGVLRHYDLYVEPQYEGAQLIGTSSVLVDVGGS